MIDGNIANRGQLTKLDVRVTNLHQLSLAQIDEVAPLVVVVEASAPSPGIARTPQSFPKCIRRQERPHTEFDLFEVWV